MVLHKNSSVVASPTRIALYRRGRLYWVDAPSAVVVARRGVAC